MLAAALAAPGCQDGYPIAATRCDSWCDLEQDVFCGAYNPATCVIECELSHRDAECYDEFDDLLRCMKMYRSKLICKNAPSTEPGPECLQETNRKLTTCMNEHPPRASSSAE